MEWKECECAAEGKAPNAPDGDRLRAKRCCFREPRHSDVTEAKRYPRQGVVAVRNGLEDETHSYPGPSIFVLLCRDDPLYKSETGIIEAPTFSHCFQLVHEGEKTWVDSWKGYNTDSEPFTLVPKHPIYRVGKLPVSYAQLLTVEDWWGVVSSFIINGKAPDRAVAERYHRLVQEVAGVKEEEARGGGGGRQVRRKLVL